MEKEGSLIPGFLIGAGLLLVLLGVLYWVFQGKLGWVGRLPGDIRIEKENFKFYMPLTTMLLFSVVVSLLLRFGRVFFDFFR